MELLRALFSGFFHSLDNKMSTQTGEQPGYDAYDHIALTAKCCGGSGRIIIPEIV